MITYDVLIVGAGPSGLMCAARAAAQGLSVCILEKKGSAGKKLLISGSGRCNITHSGPIQDFLMHYGRQGRALKPVLYGFSNRDLIVFFEERGLAMIEKDNGKIFPSSERARDVLDFLLKECSACGVSLRFNSAPEKIEYAGRCFSVSAGDEMYQSERLVIATGGMSYPGTGSTGDGYRYAGQLGHTVVAPAPALTPVIVKDFRYGECSGISLYDITISLFRDNKKIEQARGDVLFTGKGLSGPGILDISRYILAGDRIALRLVAFETEQNFDDELVRSLEKNGKKLVKNIIAGYGVPERLSSHILINSSIPPGLKASQCGRAQRQAIVNNTMALAFTVGSLSGYNEAMVTSGGVDLKEINMKTMESRIIPGLYYTGEVIDADGDTGGYNLQLAFSTGWTAAGAIAMAKKENKERDL